MCAETGRRSRRRSILAATLGVVLAATVAACGSDEVDQRRYGFVGSGFCGVLDLERFQDRLGGFLETSGVQERGGDGATPEFRGPDSDVHTCQAVTHGRDEGGTLLAGATVTVNVMIYEAAPAARHAYDDLALGADGSEPVDPGADLDVEASTWSLSEGNDYQALLVDGNLVASVEIRSFPGPSSVDAEVVPVLSAFVGDVVGHLRDLPAAAA